MKLRVLRSAVFLIVLLAAAVNAGQKEKRRPDLFVDASRSLGGIQSVAAGSWIAPEGPAQVGEQTSASSLTAFHRNTLPFYISDRFVFQMVKKGGNVYAIGEAGLLARATDVSLLAWTMANSGIPTTEDIYSLEGNGTGILLAGTGTGKIYRSSNSGSSWTLVYSNTSETDFINYIRTTDNGNGFIAVGDAPSIMPTGTPMAFLVTTNGGTNWVNVNTNITGATHPNGIRFAGTTGLLTGTATQSGKQYRGLFRTTNSGSTWSFIAVGNTPADSVTSVAAVDVSTTLTSRVLAVKGDSTLWKSTNGGVSWRKLATLPRMGYSIGFVPGTNAAYVVGRNGMIVNVDVQNDIVQSLVSDDTQLFTAVHFASATEGYLNDNLARRRYYSTINATGSSLIAPQLNAPELSSSNRAEFSWSAVTGALAYDLEIGADLNAVYHATVYSTTSLSYEIPALAPGTTYYWHVRARNLLTTGNWTSMMNFTTNSVTELKNVMPAKFPSNPSSSTDYRLVYFPSSNGVSLNAIISGSTPADYRAFRDNAGNPPNHLDELNPSSVVDYQEGFWLIKRNDFVLNTTLDSPSGSTGSMGLNLKFGWNIIGNPFPVPVKWSDVAAWNNLPSGAPYGIAYDYRGSQGYSEATVLQPFRGYYYYSLGGSLAIPFPYAATPDISVPEPEMALRLTYRSSVNEDRMLTLGVDPSASAQTRLVRALVLDALGRTAEATELARSLQTDAWFPEEQALVDKLSSR